MTSAASTKIRMTQWRRVRTGETVSGYALVARLYDGKRTHSQIADTLSRIAVGTRAGDWQRLW